MSKSDINYTTNHLLYLFENGRSLMIRLLTPHSRFRMVKYQLFLVIFVCTIRAQLRVISIAGTTGFVYLNHCGNHALMLRFRMA